MGGFALVAQQRKPDQGRARARERERGGRPRRFWCLVSRVAKMSHDMLLRNKGWRVIVSLSKRSPTFFFAFTATCTAGAYCLAQAAQTGTNPTDKKSLFIAEEKLKRNAGLHAQVLAKANKERLRVLLEEARDNKGDNSRYKAALNGESMGTHSTGTTLNAKAVE